MSGSWVSRSVEHEDVNPPRRSASRPGVPVLAAGAGMALAMSAIPYLGLSTGEPRFMLALFVATALYATALWMVYRGAAPSVTLVIVCIGLGVVGRLPLLTLPEVVGRDAIRYVWDARVQRAGLSPYEVRPDEEAVEGLHTPLTRRMDAAWLPTIYPPVAQLYFRAVTAAHESVMAFRLAAVACDAAIALVLLRTLPATGVPAAWVIAYAWHPLLWFESAAGAHVDFAGVLALALAHLAWLTNRGRSAVILYVAAILVKPLPLVLAPLLRSRVRPHHAALGAVFVLAVFAGVARGQPSAGSLGTYPAWHAASLGQPFEVSGLLLAFEFGMPVVAGTVLVGVAALRMRNTHVREAPFAARTQGIVPRFIRRLRGPSPSRRRHARDG